MKKFSIKERDDRFVILDGDVEVGAVAFDDNKKAAKKVATQRAEFLFKRKQKLEERRKLNERRDKNLEKN